MTKYILADGTIRDMEEFKSLAKELKAIANSTGIIAHLKPDDIKALEEEQRIEEYFN